MASRSGAGQLEQTIELKPESVRTVKVTVDGEVVTGPVIAMTQPVPTRFVWDLLQSGRVFKSVVSRAVGHEPPPLRHAVSRSGSVELPVRWAGSTLHVFTPRTGTTTGYWGGGTRLQLLTPPLQAEIEIEGYGAVEELTLVVEGLPPPRGRPFRYERRVTGQSTVELRGLEPGQYRVSLRAVRRVEAAAENQVAVHASVTPPRRLGISSFPEDWPAKTRFRSR